MIIPAVNNKNPNGKWDNMCQIKNREKLYDENSRFKGDQICNTSVKTTYLEIKHQTPLEAAEYRNNFRSGLTFRKRIDTFIEWLVKYFPLLEFNTVFVLLLLYYFYPAKNIDYKYFYCFLIFFLSSAVLKILSANSKRILNFSTLILVPSYILILIKSTYNLNLWEIVNKMDHNTDNFFQIDQKIFYFVNGVFVFFIYIVNSIFSVLLYHKRMWYSILLLVFAVFSTLKWLIFGIFAEGLPLFDVAFAQGLLFSRIHYLRNHKGWGQTSDWTCLIGIMGFVVHGFILFVAYFTLSIMTGNFNYVTYILNRTS